MSAADLEALEALGILLKFLVLNHLSVGSPQFHDMLEHGDDSKFADFFIDWNEFWADHGELHEDGYVVPSAEHLNAQSEIVWDFYRDTLQKLARYGAKILRLDAFAYLRKEVGKANFFNEPGTWEHLERLRTIAAEFGLTLLPEIHSEYGTGIHEELSRRGYPVYDFFLPALVIDAIDASRNENLVRCVNEIRARPHHGEHARLPRRHSGDRPTRRSRRWWSVARRHDRVDSSSVCSIAAVG